MRQRNFTCEDTLTNNWDENNLEDYKKLDEILKHLASWGFIIISTDLSWLTPSVGEPGITNRMLVLRDAVNYMLEENSREGSPFMNRISTAQIGAMGHSMGADAAILLGINGTMGHNIGAIAAIAPPNTDRMSSDNINLFAPDPVILLQGTKDVWYYFFPSPKAEDIYDAYDAPKKHLVTIHNAIHFGYTNDICTTDERTDDILVRDDQQRIAKAYLVAFFRWYLKLECLPELNAYLMGSLQFAGLEDFVIDVSGPDEDVDCNEPPVCDANGPYTEECTGATTTVSLDGTGSSDPNPGDTMMYAWTSSCPSGSFDDDTSSTPQLAVDSSSSSCSASLTITDSAGASDSCSSIVSIQDTASPSITCPDNTTIECYQSADPSISGSASAIDTCDPSPTITFTDNVTPGTCSEESTITRTWTATDSSGRSDSCVQTIEVVDTTSPVIESLSVSPDVLWPPNHKLIPVTTSVTVSDNCDGSPTVTLVSIIMNESDETYTFDPLFDSTGGDGHTNDDIQVDASGNISLRSERSGAGTGRIYTITYLATDSCGNSSSTADVTVTVPHNQ